ncbi:unnamed protein product, partial [Lampetra fluviatilis]
MEPPLFLTAHRCRRTGRAAGVEEETAAGATEDGTTRPEASHQVTATMGGEWRRRRRGSERGSGRGRRAGEERPRGGVSALARESPSRGAERGARSRSLHEAEPTPRSAPERVDHERHYHGVRVPREHGYHITTRCEKSTMSERLAGRAAGGDSPRQVAMSGSLRLGVPAEGGPGTKGARIRTGLGQVRRRGRVTPGRLCLPSADVYTPLHQAPRSGHVPPPHEEAGSRSPPPSSTSSTSSARSPAGPSRQGPPAGPARGPGAEGEGGGPSSPGPSGPPQGGPGKVPPMCARCGHEILDRFLLKVSEQCWHVRCLACSVCHSPLSRHSSCFYRDRDVFCKLDYLRRFGRKCSRCGRHVQPSDWVAARPGPRLPPGVLRVRRLQAPARHGRGVRPGRRRPPPVQGALPRLPAAAAGASAAAAGGRGGGGAGEAGEASADLLHGRAAAGDAGAVRPGQQPRRADPAEAGRPHRAQPQGHPGVVPELPCTTQEARVASSTRAGGGGARGPGGEAPPSPPRGRGALLPRLQAPLQPLPSDAAPALLHAAPALHAPV